MLGTRQKLHSGSLVLCIAEEYVRQSGQLLSHKEQSEKIAEMRALIDSQNRSMLAYHFWLGPLHSNQNTTWISVSVIGFQFQQSFKVHLDGFPRMRGQRATTFDCFFYSFETFLHHSAMSCLSIFHHDCLAIHMKVITILPNIVWLLYIFFSLKAAYVSSFFFHNINKEVGSVK